MTGTEARIATLTRDLLSDLGYHLYDVMFLKESSEWYLRFFIEKQDGSNVDLDDCRETINIIQKGKPVTLSINKSVLEFGLKGGNKNIELYTNSDSIIADNNNLTWYVESKPDWVETGVEVKKKKGILLLIKKTNLLKLLVLC